MYDAEFYTQAKLLAMRDIGLTEDEAEIAIEEFMDSPAYILAPTTDIQNTEVKK